MPIDFHPGRPSHGSWLATWLERQGRHPDEFVCGVRTLDCGVAGESTRWSYRRSSVDPLRVDSTLTLHHGPGRRLRLRMDADLIWDGSGRGPRAGFVALSGVDVLTRGRVLLAVPPGFVARFDLDSL